MKRHISTDEAVEVENVEFAFNRIETHYIPNKSYVISLGDMRWRGGRIDGVSMDVVEVQHENLGQD
jgi:hypothetical protein